MRPRLALSIGAAFHLLTGVPLLLAPGQSMSAFGFPVIPDEMLIPLRDLGVVLIGVGIINWLARNAVGAPLRGLLLGNIFIRIAIMALNVWELTIGVIPSTVGSTFPILVAINTALIVMFALALRRA